MAYIFKANAVMVSYNAITIYHVYHDNFEDSGWHKYLYTTAEYGCNDDDDVFDVRDKPGYSPHISVAANLLNMVRDGVFGPIPEDSRHAVDKDNSCEGHCPVCQSTLLNYGALEVQDECIVYPFICENCGIVGNEYATKSFDGFHID